MADEQQLRILLQGPQAWNEWRKQNPHVPKDLSGADLSGRDLSNANLAGVDLSRSKLNGVQFKGSASILVKANLQEADLTGADLDNAELSEAKLQRAILNEAVLTKARLERANLSNASLIKADLESANCKNAIFIEARLEASAINGTNFEEAKLQRALLKRADAARAHFEDARLSDTCLTAVNLQDADFSRAKGLVQSQLAGTSLYHAVLDPAIADFKELGRMEEIAKYSRKVFSILLLLCVFSWLLISQATDEILVTNSMVTSLPLIQASIPLASMFLFMPAFLLVIFVYLHLNLQGLWKGLANLPAVFPDGEILPRRAFPWIMTCLTYLYVPLLKDRRPSYWSLNVFLAILAAWIVPPLTILCFYLRYAVVGDTWGTYWLIIVIFFVVWFAADSYALTRKVFHEAGMMPIHNRGTKPKLKNLMRRTRRMVPAIIVACACYWLYAELGEVGNYATDTLKHKLINIIDYSRLIVDLRYAELSKRRPSFGTASDDSLSSAHSANLSYRRFRGGNLVGTYGFGARLFRVDLTETVLDRADFRSATFYQVIARKARLEEANLAGAHAFDVDLSNAILRSVNLSKADGGPISFKNAHFARANLRSAQFVHSDFRQANFWKADLRDASITRSDLSEAWLNEADLTNCELYETKLHGAILNDTNLSGADLAHAQGLTVGQISQACGDEKTQLPQYLIDAGVKLKSCSETRQESSKP